MNLKIKHTDVFTQNLNAYNDGSIRFIVNQGGMRSSKTYSILQCLIVIALKSKNKITICRHTRTACNAVINDFVDLMESLGIYSDDSYNKTRAIYTFDNEYCNNGSSIEFIGSLDTRKLKGLKRDILYCNEANDIDEIDWTQLMLRTSGKIFIDFNPEDSEHWIYRLLKRDSSCLIKSTYKDNVFLNKTQREELEYLINTDANYYRIYALGERPISTSRIYSHFKQFIDEPELLRKTYGLDLGFNDPTVLIECNWFSDKKVYVKQIIYESKLTTSDLINRLEDIGISKDLPIYCDHRPEVVEDIRRRGFNIKNAKKAINVGIGLLKSMEVFIHHESLELLKEIKLYSWKTSKDGRILDEPIDLHNHGLDALRYSVSSEVGKSATDDDFMIYSIDL